MPDEAWGPGWGVEIAWHGVFGVVCWWGRTWNERECVGVVWGVRCWRDVAGSEEIHHEIEAAFHYMLVFCSLFLGGWCRIMADFAPLRCD